MQYGIAHTKAHFSELTHLVDTGQEVIIAKHGKPSYRLIRLDAQPVRPPEATKPLQSLRDVQAWLHTLRSKTSAPACAPAGNFVAQWRQDARY
jgi:antitoxin (DNA-binding transcriptional repressor) of toxin-antitoxin stability system